MRIIPDNELRAKGWSIPIRRAVEAAGGDVACAYHFGLSSSHAVNAWWKQRTIRATQIQQLCELGGMKVKPEEIIADIGKHRPAKTERAAA